LQSEEKKTKADLTNSRGEIHHVIDPGAEQNSAALSATTAARAFLPPSLAPPFSRCFVFHFHFRPSVKSANKEAARK
jgi:hypothetical protein